MTAASAAFGDTWKAEDVAFWDRIWAKHCGSSMTEAILAEVEQASSVVEIGCGAGHLIHEAVARGWRGTYTGIEISQVATDCATRRLRRREGGDGAYFVCADFMDVARRGPARRGITHLDVAAADLVISRGVLQHQVHWMPMVVAALRFAPRVVMGIGYTTDCPDRHLGGWHRSGHYDVRVSLPCLRAEAAAAAVPLRSVREYPNAKRPNHQEALAVFAK